MASDYCIPNGKLLVLVAAWTDELRAKVDKCPCNLEHWIELNAGTKLGASYFVALLPRELSFVRCL